MADNITFHQYNNLHDIEDSWRSLDQQAERPDFVTQKTRIL